MLFETDIYTKMESFPKITGGYNYIIIYYKDDLRFYDCDNMIYQTFRDALYNAISNGHLYNT